MVRSFWQDECGAVLSAELALVLTILVIGVIVGLSEVAVAVNTELNDVSNAIGRLDQSYAYTGFTALDGKSRSSTAGSTVRDRSDDGDRNNSCDLVCGIGANSEVEGGNNR